MQMEINYDELLYIKIVKDDIDYYYLELEWEEYGERDEHFKYSF